MQKQLRVSLKVSKLILGVLITCIIQLKVCLTLCAQSLPGLPVPADSLQESTLQRFLTLSFDLSFNKPDQAMQYGRKAITIARHLKMPDQEATGLENIGYIFYDRFSLDSASGYFTQALKISTQSGNIKGQSKARNALGQGYFRRQQYVKALAQYNAALQLLQKGNDLSQASGIYNNMSLVHSSVGNFPKAVKMLLQALALNENSGDKRRVSLNLSNLGRLYNDMNDLPKAFDYLKRALATAREINSKPQTVSSLINLGMVSTRMGKEVDTLNFTLAWKYLNEAVIISQELKDRRNEAIAYHDLADIALVRNKLTLADNLADKSLNLKKHIESNQGLVHSFMQKAKIARKKGILNKALTNAEEAVIYAENYGSLAVKKAALELYADLLSESNKPALAFEVLQRHQVIDDSLLDEQKTKYIAQAEIAYETNKKQKAIDRLQAEKEIQQQRIVYLIIISLLFVSGAGVLILLQRKKMLLKEKESFLQQLKLHHAELEQTQLKERLGKYTSDLIRSNESVMQLQEQLGMATDLITANKTELSCLKVLREEDWVHFKELFQTVYPNFFTILKTKYPALSANDIRLAALFRLGLNSREMAGALGVEIESVKKARHRLRKKLDCNSEQDLAEYFSALDLEK